MKHPKALNTILLYTKNPGGSAEFYKKLGFAISQPTPAMYRATLGRMAISLLDQAKAHFQQDAGREPKGIGVFFEIEVSDIDGYHQQLVERGLQPSSEPHDWEWGNREFAIKDPDGYRIVFWQKSKG